MAKGRFLQPAISLLALTALHLAETLKRDNKGCRACLVLRAYGHNLEMGKTPSPKTKPCDFPPLQDEPQQPLGVCLKMGSL